MLSKIKRSAISNNLKDSINFKRVLVKIGTTNNGFTQILNETDFEPNTEFLIKGAFNLITE